MRKSHASVDSEAVFPLTSKLIISKLAVFPTFDGMRFALFGPFGSWLRQPLTDDKLMCADLWLAALVKVFLTCL